MPTELVGQQIRIREKSPKLFTEFKIKDVGKSGKLQLILAYSKRTGWQTQAYRINLGDYNSFSEANKDINSIRTSSAKKSKARKIARKWFKKPQ